MIEWICLLLLKNECIEPIWPFQELSIKFLAWWYACRWRFFSSQFQGFFLFLINIWQNIRPTFPPVCPVPVENPYRRLLGIILPSRPSIHPTYSSNFDIQKIFWIFFWYSQPLCESYTSDSLVSSLPIWFLYIQHRHPKERGTKVYDATHPCPKET